MPGPVAIAGLVAAFIGAGLIAFIITVGVRVGIWVAERALARLARVTISRE